jgi:stress response protein YsnF
VRGKSPDAPPSAGPEIGDDPEGQTELRIPLGEERVVLSKREVEQAAAHIRLRTQTEDMTVSEPLRTERVEIKRIPVDRIVATAPEMRIEGDTTIIPVVEEVLVVQFHILEEVHITRQVESVGHAQTVTLRRQKAVIVDVTDDERLNKTPSREGPS